MWSSLNLKSPDLYELDRQPQKHQRGCHCWESQDEPFAFSGRIGTACVERRNRVFSSHLIGFLLRATKKERKSTLKRSRCYVSPRQCFLQMSTNTLQQVETFKYLRDEVVFTSDESRNKGIDARFGKSNAVLRELYCSVVTKRHMGFQTTQTFQFLNLSFFQSLPVVMNLR